MSQPPASAEQAPHPFDVRHPLRTGRVFAAAMRVYRRRFRRISLTAVAVFVPLSFLEVLAHQWLEHVHEGESSFLAILVVGSVVAFFATFGEVFFTGLMDQEVGTDLRGEAVPRLRDVIRELPYVRLIVADVLFAIIVVILAFGFVIPGLVAFTAFCLVGPVINIERTGVLQGFRRSARLVRRAIGSTVLLVLVPNIVEAQIEPALAAAGERGSFWLFLGVNTAFALTLGAGVAIINVTLAHVLIARDKAVKEIEG